MAYTRYSIYAVAHKKRIYSFFYLYNANLRDALTRTGEIVMDICRIGTSFINTHTRTHARTHARTHTTVLLLFWNMSGTTRVSRYQKGKTRKVKTNLDLLEQETVSGNGICWAICKVCTSSQTTTPTSHHSLFFRLFHKQEDEIWHGDVPGTSATRRPLKLTVENTLQVRLF